MRASHSNQEEEEEEEEEFRPFASISARESLPPSSDNSGKGQK